MRKHLAYLISALIALTLAFVSCSGGGGDKTIYPTGVSLNKTTLTLNIGDAETLVATVQPSNAISKTVAWISYNADIATVNDNGRVLAIAPGTARIFVNATYNGTGYGGNAACDVTVVSPVTDVTLDKTSATIMVGNTEILTATIQPNNATNQNVTWSSSDITVATVANGLVTAVSQGIATITVTTQDGSKTATCDVTVTPAPIRVTGVTLNKSVTSLVVGDTETLTATIQPNNATNQSVMWSSDNSAVATIANGLVTALSQGIATITVITQDGGYRASCNVTVVDDTQLATGTPNTSWYNSTATTFTLYNADQLAGLAVLVNSGSVSLGGQTIILGNNIDLSVYASGQGWTPIGNDIRDFNGTFDGNGKIISNLTVNKTTDHIGLFGHVWGGIVKNLGVVNVSINGRNYVGGIAGFVGNSSVTNCYSTGTINGNRFVGGIVGDFSSNSRVLENCYSTAAVSGSYVGGIVGAVQDAAITGCAALNVSVTGNYTGRVVGILGSNSQLSNNIAWSSMLVNGSAVSGSANDRNGADTSAAAIRNGTAFGSMFNNSAWTKQSGYLPGLFGQPVPIPAHIN